MASNDGLRESLLRADPRLGRFNPLQRILCYDDFDNGVNGWSELIGNTDGNLDHMAEYLRDTRPPQLSTCTFFDQGTHGPMTGTYALKAATRPEPNSKSVLVKRLTWQKLGLVQLEMYFSFKSEWSVTNRGDTKWDGNRHPSETQFGDFLIGNDIAENHGDDAYTQRRYHNALRYVNADADGNMVQKWMYKTSVQTTRHTIPDHLLKEPLEDFQVQNPADWEEIPNGNQILCYNEIPSKLNWHYLRWQFDTITGNNVELQVNDRTMDLRDVPVPSHDAHYWGLNRLLNFEINVRTRTHIRNFFWVDSLMISVDW